MLGSRKHKKNQRLFMRRTSMDELEDNLSDLRLPNSAPPGSPRPIYLHRGLRSQSSHLALETLNPSSCESLTGRCYYIGIDFGTTYSGVAWASSIAPDNINIVRRWPTANSNLPHIHDDSKVPTSLKYSRNSEHPIRWGYEAPDSEAPLKWFKLLLLNPEDIPEDIRDSDYLKEAQGRLDEAGVTALQAVADYLKKLWTHAIQSIVRAKGRNTVDGIPFKVAITVPAIWKHYAEARMKEAARRAGILDKRLAGQTTLLLVAEPEAAALASLKERRHEIQKDEVYVVCNAGGGTTDIISYKVVQTNPLRLAEIVEGKGKLCGAMFVDEAFRNTLRTRMGSEWDKISNEHRAKIMSNEWEYGIKRVFDGNPDGTWKVQVFDIAPGMHVPANLESTLADGKLMLKCGNIKTIYGKVTSDIRGLVHDQVKSVQQRERGKPPRAIILVGGFGCSTYLYQKLSADFERKGIEVLQSDGKLPWTAICRGAVMRAANNTVESRVSRMSYGVMVNQPFDPHVHRDEDLHFNEFLERWDAKNQMEWYVKKGQDVDALQTTRFNFVRPHCNRQEDNAYTVEILGCEADPPPTTADHTVTVLCTIRCTLDIDWDDLPWCNNSSGLSFKEFSYDLVMSRGDASLEFTASFQGGKDSSVQIHVDLDPVVSVRPMSLPPSSSRPA